MCNISFGNASGLLNQFAICFIAMSKMTLIEMRKDSLANFVILLVRMPEDPLTVCIDIYRNAKGPLLPDL